MRNLFLTTCFLFLSVQLLTAQSQSVVWKKCFGGSAKDVANDVLLNSDGTMVVVGYSHSNDGNVSGHHGDASTADGWVTKLDAAGNLLWQKSLGGTANDYLKTVTAADDGGYLCIGYTYSNDGDITGNHGMADVWAIKLNDNGAVTWSKCYGGSQMDTAMDAVRLHDGQFAVAGTTNSRDGNVLSGPANNTAYDGWVIKLNKVDGGIIWEKVVNYQDSTLNDGVLNIVESNTNSLIAFMNVGYSVTFWSSDQWNTETRYSGMNFQLNELTGDAAFFSFTGAGGRDQMVMYKTNTGYNFVYDEVIFQGSPFNCNNYTRILERQDFNGNVIDKIRGVTQDCHWTQFALPESRISQPHGMIVGSNGKFITVGQANVFTTGYNYTTQAYVSNIGIVATGDGTDKFNAVKELSIGDEFITVGFTSSGLTADNGVSWPPASDFHGNLDFWVIKYQSLNTIQGNFYIDYNNNNLKDPGEPPFNRAVAKTTKQNVNGSWWSYTVNGITQSTVDLGTFKTTASVRRPYYSVSADTTTTVFTTFKNTVTINYPVHPIPGSRDYGVHLNALSWLRPGFPAHYNINYVNYGVDTLVNKQVRMVKNSHLHFSSAIPAPSSVVADTITWIIPQMLPDSGGHISLYVTVDSIPSVNLGDTLRSTVYIDSTGDVNTSDNVCSVLQTVFGSYDPNDKQENYGGNMPLTEASAGKYLTYTIRFQNTGTDTAFNITVRDTLSTLLDSTSFEMIEASHACKVSMTDGRYITWKFNGINLVDSTHNEPLSHGYISYRIKPVLPIGIGNAINNKAAIYFDYNPPVITNTSTTIIKGSPLVAVWTGAANTQWENPMNWSNGLVPDINTSVTIPAQVPNYPEINSNAACYSISVMPSATVLVKAGFKLSVTAKN